MEQAEVEHVKRLRTWLANGQKCETCKGSGKVLGHRPTIYCTDSAEEIEDSLRMASRKCPDCPDFSWALATIEAQAAELDKIGVEQHKFAHRPSGVTLDQLIPASQFVEGLVKVAESQAARITELEAIHKCPYCGGRDDLPPGHIERCYCLPAIRARDRDIEAWRKRNEKQAETIAKLESRYEDEMVAHRWFAKHFGEAMNGRDFSVKCPIATAVLVEWAEEIKRLRKSLEWITAEKHSAQADAEREKGVADGLHSKLTNLEKQLAVERGWLHKISLIGLGETWYCGSGSPSPLGVGHDCLVLAQRQEGMIKNLRGVLEEIAGTREDTVKQAAQMWLRQCVAISRAAMAGKDLE